MWNKTNSKSPKSFSSWLLLEQESYHQGDTVVTLCLLISWHNKQFPGRGSDSPNVPSLMGFIPSIAELLVSCCCCAWFKWEIICYLLPGHFMFMWKNSSGLYPKAVLRGPTFAQSASGCTMTFWWDTVPFWMHVKVGLCLDHLYVTVKRSEKVTIYLNLSFLKEMSYIWICPCKRTITTWYSECDRF